VSKRRNLRSTILRWEAMLVSCLQHRPDAAHEYVQTFIVPRYLRRYGKRWLEKKILRISPLLAQYAVRR
jgi:hypothetical protein